MMMTALALRSIATRILSMYHSSCNPNDKWSSRAGVASPIAQVRIFLRSLLSIKGLFSRALFVPQRSGRGPCLTDVLAKLYACAPPSFGFSLMLFFDSIDQVARAALAWTHAAHRRAQELMLR